MRSRRGGTPRPSAGCVAWRFAGWIAGFISGSGALMQLSGMVTLVSQRLAEGQDGPTFYPAYEIVAALNEAQRLFALLTLGLEKSSTWNVPAGTTFSHMLGYFPDWIVPLRIATIGGAKVRPSRLSDLSALDSQWIMSSGSPSRYAALGADLLALYQQPPAGYAAGTVTVTNGGTGVGGTGTAWSSALVGGWIQIAGVYYTVAAVSGGNIITLGAVYAGASASGLSYATGLNLTVTYARGPVKLVNDADVPEVPVRYCPVLVDYGIYRLRQVEGGGEFAKALLLLGSFLDGAQTHAEFVRARNKGSHYDAAPFELALYDRSDLLNA
jgi:hypothetical protein